MSDFDGQTIAPHMLQYANHTPPQADQHTGFDELPYALTPGGNLEGARVYSEDTYNYSEGMHGYSAGTQGHVSTPSLLGGPMGSGIWGNDVDGMSGFLPRAPTTILSVSLQRWQLGMRWYP